MNWLKCFAAAMCALTLAAFPAPAQQVDDASVGPSLPAHLRALLVQEMLAVLGASQEILDALVRGQDERVAARAQAIHDSFIMARQLTESDRETLENLLPEAFLERDQAFHELSARLADAARSGSAAQQRALFSDLLDACVDCHAAHALDRFPGLSDVGASP